MPDNQGNYTAQEKADLAKRRGQAASKIADPAERQAFIAAQGKAEEKNKGKVPVLDYQRLDTDAALKGYAKGTKKVPKTGPAMLTKGEMVVPKKQAAKVRAGKSSLKALYGDK